MALEKGRWETVGPPTLRVTGTDHHPYHRHAAFLREGVRLEIEADPANSHDRHACKVLHDGEQIGWVAKEQSQKMWEVLAGRRGLLIVRNHRPTQPQYDRLEAGLEVWVADAAEPSGKVQDSVMRPWSMLGICNGALGDAAYAYLKQLRNGTRLTLRSKEGRTTTTLEAPGGTDAAWFRHADMPDGYDWRTWTATKIENGVVLIPPGFMASPAPEKQQPIETPTTQKEIIVSLSTKATDFINANKSAAATAGYLEAGRIANKKVTQLAAKQLPLMARGYADTALGRLVVANLAAVAAAQLRPQDPTLRKLTDAMTVAAYQEVIQTIDIEGMLDGLLGTPEIARAVNKLNEAERATAEA